MRVLRCRPGTRLSQLLRRSHGPGRCYRTSMQASDSESRSLPARTSLSARKVSAATMQLDVQVVFPIRVRDLPTVGGGGDFTLALGEGGDLIGYSGVWRPAGAAFDAALVPRGRADDMYRGLFAASQGLDLERVEAYLAYYAAPSFAMQEFLYPVYVYLATARIGDQLVPLRAVTLPATDFGPSVELPRPAPARPKGARPPLSPQGKKDGRRRSYATVTSPPTAVHSAAALATKPWEARHVVDRSIRRSGRQPGQHPGLHRRVGCRRVDHRLQLG